MKEKTLWITRTATMFAMLIALQWITSFVPKPVGQYVTGTCVNTVLAVTALLCGFGSAATVALLSPIFAFWLGIAPNLVTVPVIALGNMLFVFVLNYVPAGKTRWQKIFLYVAAAVGKFALMYSLVRFVLCGALADTLLDQGLLKKPMLSILPATFAAPQLITALLGGGLAVALAGVIRKAIKKTQ